MQRTLARVIAELGIKKTSPHSLHHGRAMHLLEAGEPPRHPVAMHPDQTGCFLQACETLTGRASLPTALLTDLSGVGVAGRIGMRFSRPAKHSIVRSIHLGRRYLLGDPVRAGLA